MSYLTQLVRETTARVVPPSTPSWIPAQNFAEETTTAEWSGADAPAKDARPSPSVSAATEEDRNTSLPDKQELPARPRPVRSYQEEQPQPPALPHPIESAADSRGTEAPLRRTSQPDRNAAPTQPATPKRADALALNPPPSTTVYAASKPAPRPTPQAEPSPSPQHASDREKPAVAAPAPDATLTLPAILAEMARRQEVLEARYRKEAEAGRLARAVQRPPEITPSPHPQPEAEHLRLNIGSIVVQVEPPPAPRANPPATPPRQPARNFSSRRWARSFADR